MAIWQFDLLVIPRKQIQQYGCAEKLDAGCYDQHEWWDNFVSVKDVVDRIDIVLKRKESWSKDILMWGAEDSNRIDLCVTENVVSELLIRLDLRDISRSFLDEIVNLARDLSCVFCTDDWKIIDTDVELVIESLATSDAAHYVAGPEGFLEKLGK